MLQTERLTASFSFTLILLPLLTSSAAAGPLFPCINAASSKSGHSLVMVERQFEQLEGTALKTKRVAFEVMAREPFDNAQQRMSSPTSFWSGPLWSVVLAAQDHTALLHYSCGLPLVTDDGEFVILLSAGHGPSGAPALRIYRRRDHIGDLVREWPDHGVLIKEFTLRDMWPASKTAANDVGVWTDHSPQWFAGSTFDFSADNRQLIYKTSWGDRVRIDLADGTIQR